LRITIEHAQVGDAFAQETECDGHAGLPAAHDHHVMHKRAVLLARDSPLPCGIAETLELELNAPLQFRESRSFRRQIPNSNRHFIIAAGAPVIGRGAA
jgi:hypothetical protein